jgi:hypothetical protein
MAELRVGDGGAVLGASAGEWSFIFLDAERPGDAGYWLYASTRR